MQLHSDFFKAPPGVEPFSGVMLFCRDTIFCVSNYTSGRRKILRLHIKLGLHAGDAKCCVSTLNLGCMLETQILRLYVH